MRKADVKRGQYIILHPLKCNKTIFFFKNAKRDAKWPLKGFVAQSENRTDTEVTVSKIKVRQAICINNM